MYRWLEVNNFSPLGAVSAFVTCCLCLLVFSSPLSAETEEPEVKNVPPRYSLGFSLGLAYDPSDARDFMNIIGFALYDYEDIWPHKAPEQLRFKLEASIGGTLRSDSDFMASAGFFALYYLDRLHTNLLRPYIEGGVGLIYTEYKVRKQGSRLNFNPQAGLGLDISPRSGPSFWTSVRLHHLSNAGLKKDNRGVNSLTFQAGMYF